MGNGAKVALVALLILMVVVIARFVRKDSAPKRAQTPTTVAAGTKAGSQSGTKAVASPAAKTPTAKKDVSSQPSSASAPRAAPSGGSLQPRPTPPSPGAIAKTEPPAASAQGAADSPGAPQGAAPSSTPSEAALRTADLPPRQPLERSSLPSEAAAAKESFVAAVAPALSGEPPPASTRWEAKEAMLTGATSPPAAAQAGSARSPEPKFADGTWQAPSAGAAARSQDSAPAERTARAETPSASPPAVPSSSAPEAKASGFPKKHTIEQGDTYSKIARTYYGSASPRLVAHLEKANPGIDPLRLPLKREITIPAPPADWTPPQSAPAGSAAASGGHRPPSTAEEKPAPLKAPLRYLVQRGDTLSKLARRCYGDPNKFHLIEEANESLKYGGDLIAGSTITIPPLR